MIVHTAGHDSGAIAQGTSHAELGRDGLANEGALVGQFVEEVRQFSFDFECHHSGLEGLAAHSRVSRFYFIVQLNLSV